MPRNPRLRNREPRSLDGPPRRRIRAGAAAAAGLAAALGLAFLAAPAALGDRSGAEPGAPPLAPRQGPSTQIGVHFAAPFNLETPFLDLMKATSGDWDFYSAGRPAVSPEAALAGGWRDPETGLPRSLPPGTDAAAGGELFPNARAAPGFFAGSYIFEWEGDARGVMHNQPADRVRYLGPNRLRFTLPGGGDLSRFPRFEDIRGEGVKAVRLYRAEHEERLRRGEIWAPAFLDLVRSYDVIRTMDLQATNASPVRRFSDLATPSSPAWGAGHQERWPVVQRYSLPFEAVFALGVAADRALWVNIPPEIGSPIHHNDPSLSKADAPGHTDPDRLRAHARANAEAILASPEWDRFAAETLARLIASGYPPDRPLYLEVGNEIWNFAYPFVISTNYAWGLGEALFDGGDMRHGYGALTARWIMAFEDAMAAAGVRYNVTYVVASHTAWPDRTRLALEALGETARRSGRDPAALFARTGVALTTYYGDRDAFKDRILGSIPEADLVDVWEAAIARDPQRLGQRVADYFLNAPASDPGVVSGIVANWREHARLAGAFGVPVIGAYEGGSHLEPPPALAASAAFADWWRGFHWGPEGARLALGANRAILEAFPRAMLSNYLSIGPTGGAPWFEGVWGEETPVAAMWRDVAEAVRKTRLATEAADPGGRSTD